MPDLEAIGDAATGTVLATTLEARTGPDEGHAHEKNCLNCGTELAGAYCHACGQHAHVHRTLHAFWHDLLHGVLHFEGKIWHTLPLLAWRPGELTRRYIDGERAKFVSPMALFLFSVFLMFAVTSFSGGLSPRIDPKAPAQLKKSIATNELQIAALQRERDAAVRTGRSTATFDMRIADLQADLAVMRGVQAGEIGRIAKTRINAPDWLSKPLEKAVKNPDLLFYKLKTNAYKFSWALIPLSVPFLWLLFPVSRRFRLYDHTVFVTYSLAFMTLLVVTAVLIGLAGLPQVAGFAMLIPPIHIYRQLKGTYELSTGGALLRTALLCAFATLALGLFLLMLFGLGLFD
ncbi:MAG: DUF3667 domain-containing protein [Sphingomonas sp.]|nr:DUF3667 domain-containing protein [Sphingomonas sp.]